MSAASPPRPTLDSAAPAGSAPGSAPANSEGDGSATGHDHLRPAPSEQKFLGTHAGHGHSDDHGHGDEGPHVTLKGYVTGFVLSLILTAIPFYVVMGKVFDSSATTSLVVLGFAAVQIVVHMVYFLHMNTKVEGGWSMLALIFTLVLVVITLSGSLWVMYHLKQNMMPTTSEQMRNMP